MAINDQKKNRKYPKWPEMTGDGPKKPYTREGPGEAKRVESPRMPKSAK
jgi:hypothetical protein